MINYKLLFIGLTVGLLFSSCGARKKTKQKNHQKSKNTEIVKHKEVIPDTSTKDTESIVKINATKSLSTEEYVALYANIAVANMKDYHIPASITLAQAILESNSGKSDLTLNSNNHFGIKCHTNWTGLRTYYDDDHKGECFRVYQDPALSFDDHALFLTQRSRYQDLFKLNKRDYKAWAHGLQKAGYATDKKYPQKLIGLIEKYDLQKYDETVLGKEIQIEAVANPSVYIVQKGDGLYGIARKYGIDVETLMSINQLETSTIYPGQKLYLKPIETQVVQVVSKVTTDELTTPAIIVKDSIPPKKELIVSDSIEIDTIPNKTKDFHIVVKGETLYQIAYKYELEIPDIRRWNGIKKDEISIGQRLFLSEPNTTKSVVEAANTHTVVKEDTLYSISKLYGLNVAELKTINNLQDNTIFIGQILRIK